MAAIDPNAAIEATLDRANLLFSSGLGTTTAILKEADELLSKKLSAQVLKAGGPDVTFTEAHAVLWRKQIQLTQAYLDKRLAGHTHEQAKKAIGASVKDTVKVAKLLEKKFTGITSPLALEQQGMQDTIVRGVGSSLLRQHQTSIARYSKAMVGEFERVMRVGFISGMNQHQVISRMVDAGELGGINAAGLHASEPAYFPKPTGYVRKRYWAERIVRTESAYAYNAAGLRTLQTAKVVDFPDMQKKIVAHFDLRTAPDSVAVHGQIRPVDGLFRDGAGREYLHPPARPNDRETVLPWRPHWTELPATAPLPPAAQAAAQVAAAPPVTSGPVETKAGAKKKLKGLIEKAKAVLAAKAPAAAPEQAFELAKAKAVAAQLEGQQAAAKALAGKTAKSASKKTAPANLAELKAKAEAYQEQKKAAVAAKKLELEAKRAAAVKAQVDAALPVLQEASSAAELTKQLKAIHKTKPRVFSELYKQATGKPLAGVPSAQSAGKMAQTIGKKLKPDLDWAKKKPKAVMAAAVDADLQLLKAEFSGSEAGPALKHWKDQGTVKKLFDELGFELKPEGGGSSYVNVFKGETKITYFTKVDDTTFKVSPPANVQGAFPEKTFSTPEAAGLYGSKVSEAIKSGVYSPAKAVSAPAVPKPAPPPGKMPWSEKWKPPVRKKLELDNPARRVDMGLAQDTRHGISVAADGDAIEDFQVYFSTEIRGSERTTVVRFRVNEFRAADVRDKLDKKLDAQYKKFPGYPKLASLSSPRLEMLSDSAASAPGVAMKRAAVKDVEVRYFEATSHGSHPALKNMVELRFAEPAQPGARFEKFKMVADELGIKSDPPKPKDLKAYRRAKVLALVDRTELASTKQTPEEVERAWEKAVKRQPELEQIEKDAELREIAPGHFALYSEKLAKKWKDAGVKYLEHSVSGGSERIRQLLIDDPEAGLLSSRERFNRGLIFHGMSTLTDFETGGADSVFMRLRSGLPSRDYGTLVEVDPSEMGRLDMYAFNSDQYGNASEGALDKRLTLKKAEALNGNFGDSNEVMLRRTIHPTAIRRLFVSSGRLQVIKQFKEAGISEVNGIPIEEFVAD